MRWTHHFCDEVVAPVGMLSWTFVAFHPLHMEEPGR